MSCLPCNFCTHGNPEGSRFCNACGSPLNLTQCSWCEAINSVSSEECFQCGAPLSQDTGEVATSPVALTEAVQSSESAPRKGDRVPVVFAESLEARPVHSHVASHEPEATGEDQPSLAPPLTADPASHDDDRALSPPDVGRATYSGRNPSHVAGFLVVVFVAIAGAAIGASYWISVKPTQPPDSRTVMDGARTAAPEPAPSTPAAPQAADSPTGSPTPDSAPTTVLVPSSAGSSQSPATGESISPGAGAGQSTAGASKSATTTSPGPDVEPRATGQAPESVSTETPFRTVAAESVDGGTPKAGKARATNDSNRTLTRGRTREQAERDADATRRLVARELANSPPSSDN